MNTNVPDEHDGQYRKGWAKQLKSQSLETKGSEIDCERDRDMKTAKQTKTRRKVKEKIKKTPTTITLCSGKATQTEAKKNSCTFHDKAELHEQICSLMYKKHKQS